MAKNKHSENMTKLKLIWKVYGGHPIRLAKRLFLGEIPIDAYVQVSKSGKNIEEDKELVSVVIPIYDRVQELRESIGMSRKEFSEHTGIPVRTLEDWEAARRTPPEYIPRLIAYQLKYQELLKDYARYKSD